MAAPTTTEPRINDRIRAREVRLVGADGQQIGIKPLPEALQLAREQDLDLVEVAPLANPPVCRIMDYGKYKYEEAQRAKESRRKSSNVSIKEMKYRPKIGTGDFDTKTRKIAEFLSEGHKVKVTIMFRGRELQHPELGMKILTHVAEEVAGEGKIEAAPKIDGRNMIMVLAPEKKAKPKAPRPETTGPDAEPDLAVDTAAPAPATDAVAPAAPASPEPEPDATAPVVEAPDAETTTASAPS